MRLDLGLRRDDVTRVGMTKHGVPTASGPWWALEGNALGGFGDAWIALVLAGLFEIGWAIGLKYTDGFSKFWPSLVTIVLMAASFSLLSEAIRQIPIGTAYAVWTGIGAVGAALVGIVLFGDSATPARLTGLALIVGGIVVLKLAP
jgi:quaternary ammonium compound-resistance protein SugE